MCEAEPDRGRCNIGDRRGVRGVEEGETAAGDGEYLVGDLTVGMNRIMAGDCGMCLGR